MKNGDDKRVEEVFVLLYSAAKWGILSLLAGLIVGGAASVFLLLLEGSVSFVGGLPFWRILLLPLGLLASAFLIKTFAPEAHGHGTEKVIEAVHCKEGYIPLKVVPVKLAATITTLASGGSAGKEGPCAQIGGGLMS
ncbi:chloride channel protein, partial [Acetomicrobium hydrogeniformans]|nr:voltage-gated chloride channel [Acetomicrobium hydrogeniformans]